MSVREMAKQNDVRRLRGFWRLAARLYKIVKEYCTRWGGCQCEKMETLDRRQPSNRPRRLPLAASGFSAFSTCPALPRGPTLHRVSVKDTCLCRKFAGEVTPARSWAPVGGFPETTCRECR